MSAEGVVAPTNSCVVVVSKSWDETESVFAPSDVDRNKPSDDDREEPIVPEKRLVLPTFVRNLVVTDSDRCSLLTVSVGSKTDTDPTCSVIWVVSDDAVPCAPPGSMLDKVSIVSVALDVDRI